MTVGVVGDDAVIDPGGPPEQLSAPSLRKPSVLLTVTDVTVPSDVAGSLTTNE